MKLLPTGSYFGLKNAILLVPDNAEEAGILSWLAARYKGDVRIVFDTTSHLDVKTYPMLWLGEKVEEP